MATTSPVAPVPREPLAQRLIAALLRVLLRSTLMTTFRAGRPVAAQRRRLARFTRLAWVPRAARFTPGSCGGVAGEWVEGPSVSAPASRAILYLHGGAYCVGSPATHRAITARLAESCRARLFAADYRLAPEHPFPAAVDDAVAAFEGLLQQGYAPQSVVVAGDSAGGGLSLALALRLHELGAPLPASLVLFSPWTDLTLEHLVSPPPAGEAMVTRGWIEESAGMYLAGRDRRQPLASPVYADLAGLPPTLIQVGSDELLRNDACRLHERLQGAGVSSELQVFPRRWHVFQVNAGLLADADRAIADAARFVDGCHRDWRTAATRDE